ncbi:MAG: hypothetical protein CSYNP_04141 [Syntrophus sp. SKADARSKE-3]|nr:hypothetical protein [Syntrophus sp. SKADARSKE-3]
MHVSEKSLRTGHKRPTQTTGWLVLACFLLIPADLFAQAASPLATAEKARFSFSAASAYQFKSDLDGGGDVSAAHYGVGVGGMIPLAEKAGLGVRMTYNREDYRFSETNGFHVANPWDHVNRVGFSLRLGYQLTDQWSIGAGPVAESAGETGAQFNDTLMYGGIVSAVYRASADFSVGLGAGVFYRLSQTKVFPSLLISWKIADRLHLANGSRLGLIGPAGLELSYKFADNWEAAVGGGSRSLRFRLNKDGSTPGGIGENSNWPVYARVSRKLGSAVHLDLYGGAAFRGEMKLEDKNGNGIASLDYKTAPVLGINLQADF